MPVRVALLLVVAFLLAGLALAPGCSEEEDPLHGFNVIGGIVDSTNLRTLSIEASDLDTYFQTTRNTGTRIWAGREVEAGAEAEAKALLRFRIEIPADAVLIADTLRLQADARGDYGHATGQTLNIERVLSDDWFTDDTQGWPFTAHEPLTPATSFTPTGFSDTMTTLVTVQLPPSLIQSWVAEPDSNFGLAFVAGSGSGWKRFLAIGPLGPVLGVRYEANGETTQVRLGATHGATVYSLHPDIAEIGEMTGEEPFARAGGAFDFRAVVRFDLSPLPTQANVHRLRIELPIDPDLTGSGETGTAVTVGAHQVISLPGENLGPRPVVGFVTDPATTTTLDVASDSVLALEVSQLGREFDDGILIKVERDFPSLVRFGVKTREAPAGERPRLTVTYSLPARIRL